MSYMLTEIEEQPDWIARAVAGERKNAIALATAIRGRDIQFVVIAARGTSDNAATYAKYLIEIATGLPVALAAPSVFTLYDAKLSLKNALVIGISRWCGYDSHHTINATNTFGTTKKGTLANNPMP